MISVALRTDIERWASRKDERPLIKMAENGTLTKAMVRCYIANATWIIKRTPGHIKRARDGARALGDERLAAHYDHKLSEEVGHAAWGEADLESFTSIAAASVETTTPAIESLARYLDEMTAGDPVLYLTYLAFTEYITVLLGPELLTNIEERCGVARTAMTIIDKHIELDRDHAEEGFGVIDDLVDDPSKIGPMREALARILTHFDGFCEQVTKITEVGVDSERQISAA
jgi:hypothetical protein